MATERAIPPGDDRERDVCSACAQVHYANPKVVVGCLVEEDGALLLCRRAIEPAVGLWTPPAGYLELGESTADGAARETREEAGAEVEVGPPHTLLDVPHIGQCYALFHARLAQGARVSPGVESQEARFFALSDLPFGEIAFPVLHFALELYAADALSGIQRMHTGVVRGRAPLRAAERFDPRHYELARHRAFELTH